jgi:hypothetical protein
MEKIEDIQAAIASLPAEDYRRLVDWFREREQTRWDEQLDRDSEAAKLDFVFGKAE